MRKIVTGWLVILLIGSSFIGIMGNDKVAGKPIAEEADTYIVSAPFRINSNADFATSGKCSGGDGTIGNPWRIENYSITGIGFGYCMYIGNTTDHFRVRGCYLFGATGIFSPYYYNCGLVMYNVRNGIIINNTAVGSDGYGFYLSSSDGNAITNNNASVNDYGGITLVSGSDDNTISNNTSSRNWKGINISASTNNTVSNNTAFLNSDQGIYLSASSTGNTISDCSCYWNDYGIFLSSSGSNTIINNSVKENNKYGIYLLFSNGTTISGNNASSGDTNGIYLSASSGNTIIYNNASSNLNDGICLASSSNNNTITNNTARLNSYGGIRLKYSMNNTIAYNDVTYNSYFGIFLEDHDNWTTVTNNNISANAQGIQLSSLSNDNTIANNYHLSGNRGIVLESSSRNVVDNNTLLGASGIQLGSSANYNVLRNNTITNNYESVYISWSSFNSFFNNTMTNSGLFFNGPSTTFWNSHFIDTSNTVNGKPVQYWKNQTSGTVPPGAGQVILANCTNVVVENQNFSHGSCGVVLGFSNGNNLTNNTASHAYRGFYLYSSGGNNIINNTLLFNVLSIHLIIAGSNCIANNTVSNNSYGINLASSSNNVIVNNTALNNSYGIYLSSSSTCNNIANNTASNSGYGIYLTGSSTNTISDNTVLNNNYGIATFSSSNTNIISNNTASNSTRGIFISLGSTNTIADNTISDCSYGITVSSTVSSTVKNNIMVNDGIIIWGTLVQYWNSHIIDTSNTVNGKPVYYMKNLNGGTVPQDAGQVILANCSNFQIKDLNVSDGTCGILFGFSNSNIISNNTMSSNNGYGIYHETSKFNRIYHNNFIDNTVHAYQSTTTSVNIWNASYPTGGNYWSDYTGTDIMKGTNQNELGCDGFGDTPYINITGTAAQDKYPRMHPTWFVDTETPVADAGPDEHIGTGTTVIFNGSESTDNGPIASYSWTFIDGTPITRTGVAPTYKFNNAGVFNVTLNVTDLAGLWDTDVVQITVNDTIAPVANAGSDWYVNTSDAVFLDASDSTDNVGIINYTWTFVDSGSVTLYGINRTHRFDAPGVYSVMLNVTDAAGLWDTDIMNVTVNATAAPLTADAGPDIASHTGETVAFDGSGSAGGSGTLNYTWAFTSNGSAVSLFGIEPTFIFWNAGNYTVTLNLTDGTGAWSIDTLNVNVTVPPVTNDTTPPVADAGPDITVTEGSEVTLNASRSTDDVGIANYTWTIPYDSGNITLYGPVVSHTFAIVGNYTVTLTVRDVAGNNDSDTVDVLVTESVSVIDSDGDGWPDEDDEFPDNPEEWADLDDDGIGDNSDEFPDDPNEWTDSDYDGTGDNSDEFPYDPTEFADTDGDGIGNNADTDDDGDGFLDDWEIVLGTDPLDFADAPADTDGDGTPDGDSTNSQPWMDTDDDGDAVPDDEEALPPVDEFDFLGQYWWILIIIVLSIVAGLLALLRRKREPVEVPAGNTDNSQDD